MRGCVILKKYKSQGKALVEVTVNNKEENSLDIFLDFIKKFGLKLAHNQCLLNCLSPDMTTCAGALKVIRESHLADKSSINDYRRIHSKDDTEENKNITQ